MCLHPYGFVFSLQEAEENLTFQDLLETDDGTDMFDQEEFDGFSFANH
jgi:hypothetical protein